MRSDSLKVLLNLIRELNFFRGSFLIWSEFYYPSTLQLSEVVKVLIEPTKTNKILFDKVGLGLHEALVNAVKHGNRCNNSKKIRVRRIITPKWFIWQIQDEGSGTPIYLRNYALPINLDASGGRGLYIISQCFDDIRWSSKGNRIQLACRKEIKN